jgi:hypothetical protein
MSSRRIHELEATWRIKLTPELIAKIDEAVEQRVNEKLEEVVKKCLKEREEQAGKEVLKLRKISHEKAVPLIKKYIDENQGCRTSDIIYDLALDPDLVLNVLKKLQEKSEIRGEDVE